MKRFIYKTVFFLLLVSTPVWVVNWIVDPLQFYRKAYFYPPAFYKEQRFQNPGLAKNYEYDVVLIGTSMSENFRAREIDSLFGCKSLKLTMSGSSLYEQRKLLELALNKKPGIVFWGIESYTLNSSPDKAGGGSKHLFPDYLYDNNILNDALYVFNGYMFRRSIAILTGTIYRAYKDVDEIGRWGDDNRIFNRDSVLNFITHPDRVKKAELFAGMDEDFTITNGMDNIEQNVIELVKGNPDTEFYLFFTPPSALVQLNAFKNGVLENKLFLRQYFVSKACELANIKCFDFESDRSIVTDLDNYKDSFHYCPKINSEILRAMYLGDNLCTQQEIGIYNSTIRDLAMNFKPD
jgi:hypothetical protein